MWNEGSIRVGSDIFHYRMKVFEEPSHFGINGGRISKLMLKRNGIIVYNYDRGVDVEPADKATQSAVRILLYSER